METQTLDLRYAHSDGHTNICYSTDGSLAFTSGMDGDVRAWPEGTNDDPVSECVGEMALAFACHGDHFYVGTEHNHVQAYKFPNPKRDGIICRFSAPVTYIAVSNDGSKIAASSCDMEVQVAFLDGSNPIQKLIGHTAPVNCVAFDSNNTLLASSSCDGSVKVWDILSGNVIKSINDVIPKCNDFFRVVVTGLISWRKAPTNFLAVPQGKQIIIYDSNSWDVTTKLQSSKIISDLSLASFSPCGNMLAATSTSGELILWDIPSNTVLSYYEHPRKVAISGLDWHPEGHTIALADRLGQYCFIRNVDREALLPAHAFPEDATMNEDGDADEDNENAISLEDIKRSSGWVSPSKMDDASSVSSVEDRRSDRVTVRQNLQQPFQPSSTPVHLQQRFMVWNNVGIVRCFNIEDEKSIDVEFHDSMFHHALHMSNYDDYSMAALSDKVLALACASTDETPSKLTCILLNAWDGSKEWSLTMPDDENIVAVAAAGNWVAVATDSYNLRIFSFAGTQRPPISLPGPPICLSGHEEKLCVVYHQGIGIGNCQNLGITVFDIQRILIRTKVPPQPLPLHPRSLIRWIGFTDEGRLCAFDSIGILRTLSQDYLHWLILTDTRMQPKGPTDNFFIVGVSEKLQNIRCVLCKGGYYPMTTPKPTVVEIPLRLPLCDHEAEKSSLEETFWRLMSSIPSLQAISQGNDDCETDVSEFEKTLKQTVIKLFANACRADVDIRASDIASLMPEHPLQMAAKYASKSGKMYLAEKLSVIDPVDWSDAWLSSSTFYAPPPHQQIYENIEEYRSEAIGDSQRDMFEEVPSTDSSRLLIAERESQQNGTKSAETVTPLAKKNPFKIKPRLEGNSKGLTFFDKPVPPKLQRSQPVRSTPPTRKVGKTKKENERKNEVSEVKEMHKLATESQKRKLDDSNSLQSSENVKKVASSKLSAFAFKK